MSQKETKYICYTGIGSNKTGTHTTKDFLKRMEKLINSAKAVVKNAAVTARMKVFQEVFKNLASKKSSL